MAKVVREPWPEMLADVDPEAWLKRHLKRGKLPCPSCGKDLLEVGVAYDVPYIHALEVVKGRLEAVLRDKCFDAATKTKCNDCLSDLPTDYQLAIEWL